jgi:hypothetical protein
VVTVAFAARTAVVPAAIGDSFRGEEDMVEGTLDQVQRLAEQLSPYDQARLLASLALRMAHVMASSLAPGSATPQESAEAWEKFFRLGEALTASDTSESETLTEAVLAMRR